MELTEQLKQHVASVYRKKYGDDTAYIRGRDIYTGNQAASEIENETDEGIRLITSLINLTIELVQKQKI